MLAVPPPTRRLLRPPPVVRALYGMDLLLGLVALAFFVTTTSLGLERVHMFRLSDEGNVPTWYSSSQLLVVALAFGVLVVRDVRYSSPRTWVLLLAPLLFLLLSLDEIAMLHERAGALLQSETGVGTSLRSGPWMHVAVPAFVAFAAAGAWALRPYWRGRPDVALLALVGAALFVGSAAGWEHLGNYTAQGSWQQKTCTFIEEIGEMMGATTMLWAALLLLRHEGVGLCYDKKPDEAPAG